MCSGLSVDAQVDAELLVRRLTDVVVQASRHLGLPRRRKDAPNRSLGTAFLVNKKPTVISLEEQHVENRGNST
jgi:hypothetical protein